MDSATGHSAVPSGTARHNAAVTVTFPPVAIMDQLASSGERIEVYPPSGTRLLVPRHAREAICTLIGSLQNALVGERTEDQACWISPNLQVLMPWSLEPLAICVSSGVKRD